MVEQPQPRRVIGRYALFDAIASGGMATVHFGRLMGPIGFCRTVAIKRLHPEFARDPEFVAMFVDEARLAARIRHPNVVQTLDVVAEDGELFLVMDYVLGAPLSVLLYSVQAEGQRIPPRVVTAIVSACLQGLHAAHEACDERGQCLGIVHRDVSPQNILVGADGVARVLDFGIAKAAGRAHTTRDGAIKGKVAYMAPEQLESGEVTRQADVYSTAVVLWEALTGSRAFAGDSEAIVLSRAMFRDLSRPSSHFADLDAFDEVVKRGLARNPDERYQTARQMALELEACAGVASQAEVSQWLDTVIAPVLRQREAAVATIETFSDSSITEVRKQVSSMRPLPPDPPPPRASALTVLDGRPSSDRLARGSSESTSVSVAVDSRSYPRHDEASARIRRGMLMTAVALAATMTVGVGIWLGGRVVARSGGDAATNGPADAPPMPEVANVGTAAPSGEVRPAAPSALPSPSASVPVPVPVSSARPRQPPPEATSTATATSTASAVPVSSGSTRPAPSSAPPPPPPGNGDPFSDLGGRH